MILMEIKLILTSGKLPHSEENMNRVESIEIQLDLAWEQILAAGIASRNQICLIGKDLERPTRIRTALKAHFCSPDQIRLREQKQLAGT